MAGGRQKSSFIKVLYFVILHKLLLIMYRSKKYYILSSKEFRKCVSPEGSNVVNDFYDTEFIFPS